MRRIRELIRDGRKNPLIRSTAEAILDDAEVEPRDQVGEAGAIFEWVRDHFRFTSDPVNVEMLTTAEALLHETFADCDEYVILMGALLESIGRPVRIKLARKGTSGPWRHVYLEVKADDTWIPADATHPHQPLGWEVGYGDARVIGIDGPFRDEDLGFLLPIIGSLASIAPAAYEVYKAHKADKDAEDEAKKAAKREAKRQKEEVKLASKRALPDEAFLPTQSLVPVPASDTKPWQRPDPPPPPTVSARDVAMKVAVPLVGGIVLLLLLRD